MVRKHFLLRLRIERRGYLRHGHRLSQLEPGARKEVPLLKALVRPEKLWSRRLPSPHQKGNSPVPYPAGFVSHGSALQSIRLGKIFADSVRNHPDLLELVTPPSFSLSVFRIAPGAVPELFEDELNELNERFYEMLCERKDLMLTQTKLNGIHCIR